MAIRPIRQFPQRCGKRIYTITVGLAGRRWYAEARYRGVLYAAGSGDTPAEALAFVRAQLEELAGAIAA